MLARFRADYARNTRYRTYDDLTPTISLKALTHKTGWVLLGDMDFDRNLWKDYREDTLTANAPFAFTAAPRPARTIPRANDRIRLRESQTVVILDYGSLGEARRNESPTTRDELYVSDQTTAKAEAGRTYVVADVRIKPNQDHREIWVRLVAP